MVTVERLLLDDPAPPGDIYKRFHTYLCQPRTFTASPGSEPEPEAAALYAIAGVGWYALFDETTWDRQIMADPLTAPLLRRIRSAISNT